MTLFSRLFILGLAATVTTGALLPASAEGVGDPRAGEALFYEHAFAASPSSIPVRLFEAFGALYPETFSRQGLEQRFGLLHKPERALPIGFVMASSMGMERISFNCSLCHTGLFNGTPTPGMPNSNLRMQEFEETFLATVARPELTGDVLVEAVKRQHPDLSLMEQANLRFWLFMAKQQAPNRKPSPHRAGPGRFDLLATFKSRLGLKPHTFNAQMDIAPLFGQATIKRYPRDGALGGDPDLTRYLIVRLSGDNTPLKDGQYPAWVKDLNAFMFNLQPPKYPGPIDAAQAKAGRLVFRNTCSPCHGTYDVDDNQHPNRIIPIDVVGTDRNRIQVWDEASVAFVKADPLMSKLELSPGVGFMPPSLRGVWATSPYLHNGSVPTIYDVLSEPGKRPKQFYRGGDPFDPVKVGLSSVSAPASADQFLYDTGIPGNGNQGHPFGVPLSETERMAVIEYLKTL